MMLELRISDVWVKGRSYRVIDKIVGQPPELIIYSTMTQRNQITDIDRWKYWVRTAQLSAWHKYT
jgi:hypothetical protein